MILNDILNTRIQLMKKVTIFDVFIEVNRLTFCGSQQVHILPSVLTSHINYQKKNLFKNLEEVNVANQILEIINAVFFSFLLSLFLLNFGYSLQFHTFCKQIRMESFSELDKPNGTAGIDITFKNVSYSVKISKKVGSLNLRCIGTTNKHLLTNVSGIFKAGEVTAIMGASGAGKTTLLNVLAQRVPVQEGEIMANNLQYSYEHFGDFANYVMQSDIFMQTLTVRETLRFAADLKLDVSETAKEEVINQMAKGLKLEGCLDTLVGGTLVKGISGGEKKRTSIAFELISDPEVIMLDEPTSGLDSLTSYIIVKHLTELAHTRNKTVIMTIHQPNSEIFDLFDKLLLMVEGRLIYQGEASSAPAYFSTNFGLSCPEFHNPADFFMSIMHGETKQNVERYAQYFEEYNKNFAKKIERHIENRSREEFQKRVVSVSWSATYCTLLQRDIKNILRNPLMIKSRLFQTLVLAIYIGGLYCKFGPNYKDTITFHALTGFFFFLSINSVFIALTPIALTFPLERNVFLKEESAKLYGVTSYFLSKNTVETPYALVFPILQSLIMYWFLGLSSTAGQFFTFLLIIFLCNMAGMSIGMLAGSLVSEARFASGGSLLILFPLIIFSGFFKNQSNLAGWIGWIQYVSPFKYGFSAFMQNEVMNRTSNIGLLNFDVGLWESVACLAALGVAARLLSWFFLWKLRTKLE